MAGGGTAGQLERILASPLFAQSQRLSRFLRFVVESAEAGRAEALKEYAVGVEVFERGDDFDPRIDNVVRVHAAKLRSKLLEYYASTGAGDPLIITIPKGSYVPEIRARESQPAAVPDERSRIAVLPFVNMSSDPENEYFSDGLTEELINRLAGNPSLHVVARTSAFAFKGLRLDLREIGARLNVGLVLEGSVRRAGEQLRVTAQLIDVKTGFHIFSRTFQREFRGIFELQDEIALSVTDQIAPRPLDPHKHSRTSNPDAYHAYLRGMFAMANRFTDLPRCLDLFREALRHDPEFAPAWAGMAQGYFMMAWFYHGTPSELLPLSREAAQRALKIDPDSAPAMHSLGVVECVDWNWQSAESRFRRAIHLQPTAAIGYVNYAMFCLLPQLREDEACDVLEQGLRVDPFNPLLHAIAIYGYGRSGRYEEALRQYELARTVSPGYAPMTVTMGNAHEWAGQPGKALDLYREACAQANDAAYPLSCLGHALAINGDHQQAEAVLARLLALPHRPAADIARLYCGLRNAPETLRWLEQAAKERSLYLLRCAGDPRFGWLSGEPRLREVLQRMKLPTRGVAAKAP